MKTEQPPMAIVITGNAEPTQCCPECGSKETKETNIYKCNDSDVCEYTLKCKNCDFTLGHWAYGNWQY